MYSPGNNTARESTNIQVIQKLFFILTDKTLCFTLKPEIHLRLP